MKSLQWFINRIGKKIYRDSDNCECSTCKEVVKNGLIIHDKNHAEYLHMVHSEGIDYRDKQKDTPLDVSSKI